MKRSFVLHPVILIGLLFIFVSVSISRESTKMPDIKGPLSSIKPKDIQSPGGVGLQLDPDFGKFPIYFIINKGQVNETAAFYARASMYTLWLTKQGLVFDSTRKVEVEATHPAPSGHPSQEGSNKFPHSHHSPKIDRDVSRLMFIGTKKNPEIVPIEEIKHKVNYFIGNDKSKWHCNIPTSRAVLYKSLYKKIDLKVYGIEKQIEYDWMVKPGGNPGNIRFQYKNVKSTGLDKEGNLVIETDFGELMHKRPLAYQKIKEPAGVGAGSRACPGNRKDINVTFKKLGENTYGFEVEEYDRSSELIIDPVVLLYSTYLGGNSSDRASAIAVDNNENVYMAGVTYSTDFPTLRGYQKFKPDENERKPDVFVTMIDTKEKGVSGLIYSTYLGGDDEDYGMDIAVDNRGNVYVTGETYSKDFPTKNQYQELKADEYESDAFVTKLDTTASGVSSLVYSTYLGGGIKDSGRDIAVDNRGNVYVTGSTHSHDFPTKRQYQRYQSGFDAFVTKLNTREKGVSSLCYSTYLGGNDNDGGRGIAVDNSGNVYVTGYTYSYSTNFPTRNPYQTFGGAYDAFISKIDTTKKGDSSLIYSTYLGGNYSDYGSGIAVDNSGNVYVTGYTDSTNFPTLNPYQTFGGAYDAFISKIDTKEKGVSSLLYSTYLGGWSKDFGSRIAVISSGNVFITGSTFCTDFPVRNPYQTFGGAYDAFISKIDTTKKGDSSLIYSTYLGGNYSDYGRGIAVDNSGNVYLTGATGSTNFPTLNPYQTDQGKGDAFVTKLIAHPGFPYIQLDRSSLNFDAIIGGSNPGSRAFSITNPGSGTLNWTVSSSKNWIKVKPCSGTGSGLVTVSVDISGLTAGSYRETISIADPSASNSPRSVSVTLNIYTTGTTGVPFGQFSTPVEGSIARGSIPVTGWALDDIGVQSVQIFMEEKGTLVFIGDAVFVEGARPDVELAYPGYPNNHKAGWGYMMLTNFLHNGGNGTFNISTIATDIEGNHVTLGIKTIICDNANAVKPFGAIDTPTQGGIASGSDFVNFGWALTPPPNSITIDGSTITVWVDGVSLGNPVYNRYREDIAALFPGYNNSSGAGGYFYLDTNQYENGVHTISWSVSDDAGNTDGIGSRYFSIQNTSQSAEHMSHSAQCPAQRVSFKTPDIPKIPVDYSQPLRVKKGFNPDVEPQILYLDETGQVTIEIKELERVEICLSEGTGGLAPMSNGGKLSNRQWTGFQVIGNQFRSLPIGSFLDPETGIFSWAPGPGHYGRYRFVFLIKDQQRKIIRKDLTLQINPRFQ